MQPIIIQGQVMGDPAGYTSFPDMFTYQVPVFSNLAVNAQATNQLLIQADADFEWVAAVYEFDLAAAAFTSNTRPLPNCTVQITDTGSGRQLMNAAVPVTSIFGGAEQPQMLPITKVFKRNASIQFTVTNFDAAVTNGNLRLSLLGWKRFYFTRDQITPLLPA